MSKISEILTADIAVVGAGPTGMTAALQAADAGKNVVFIAPSGTHTDNDGRTTAVMLPGLKLLKKLGIWDTLQPKTAPLDILRIVDATKRLLRAPTVDFRASELGEPTFGHNVKNSDLNAALADAVTRAENIKRIDAMVSAADFTDEKATLICSDGTVIEAQLAVAADGANSLLRKAANISNRSWAYPQTATVLTFKHKRPHNFVSTEFHTEEGPFTQVPLPGNESSLVWVQRPEKAEITAEMETGELGLAIEKQMSSMLGAIEVTSAPQTWPLSTQIANAFSATRLLLVGHAAHAFPPIGAQGLNLGLRDIVDLGEALAQAESDDVGSKKVTDFYHSARRNDVWSRTAAVDLLNRSLLTDLLPVQAVRAGGLSLLKYIPPLRSFMMREGMMPGSSVSRGTGLFSKFNRRGTDQAA